MEGPRSRRAKEERRLIKKMKADAILLYFLVSVLFMEVIFRISTSTFDLSGFLLTVLFLSGITIFIYFIVGFFQGTFRFLLTVFLLGVVGLVYSSQLIYMKFFKTYYTMYSLIHGSQIAQFWRDILVSLGEYWYWLLLLFTPVLLLIVLGKRVFGLRKMSGFKRVVLVFGMILFHLAGVAGVYAGGKGHHSAYDVYFQSNYPIAAAERLGLLTMMRIDLQRLITNWSPKISPPPVVAVPEKADNEPSSKKGEEHPQHDEEPVEEEIEYNIMDIDFTTLIEEEEDGTVQEMHQYFEKLEPTAKNEYTGKFKGDNLILLTAESFSPLAVDEEVTPTLYKMIHECYEFTNFYTPIWETSTSDGEYVALQSLISKSGIWSFQESGQNNLPLVLGNQFKKLGYETRAYHNHSYTYYGRDMSHPNLGYDYKALGNGLEVKETWPESDVEMMEKTISEYVNNPPFHTYYMTVSGHMQYSFVGNYIAWKNQKYVEDLPYSDQAKAYLAANLELDRALEYLLEQLEEAGIANETVIALSGDHYPYGLDAETIDELAGHPVEQNFELYKNHFILYKEGMEHEKISKPASSLDILPTLSNLFGLDYDSRLMMGTDIFSDSKPLIPFLNKSFITDKGRYNAVTGEYDGEEVNQDYLDFISSQVEAKFYYSAKILEKDYYDKISIFD